MNFEDRVSHIVSEAVGVLIVEDEALTALAASAILSELGYDVVGTAATADAALRLDAELRPDLVLMDVTLRGEPDGISAAKLLRRQSGVPILFVSAHTDPQTLRRAASVKPVGYLVKPYSPQQLGKAVAAARDALRFDAVPATSGGRYLDRAVGVD